jgi:hypothetical protein
MKETVETVPPSVEDIQKGWNELSIRVAQLEAERAVLTHENKSLRALLEREISYRQTSHTELVLMLTNMVSKLPINDTGVIVSKLVEHNTNVSQMLAAMVNGTADGNLPEPVLLKSLEESKREISAALKPIVDELLKLDPPLEESMVRSLAEKPESFFSPAVVRANRGFVKGYIPRERIVKEFGEEALAFFNDRTTDPKLNPRPKPEEIALEFKPDFEAWFQQNPNLVASKRQELSALYKKVQASRAQTEQARAQKNAFFRLSFLIELLHFYEHSDTEPHDVVFANRLPSLVEQLALGGPLEQLDEKLIVQAEGLLAHVTSTMHRQMIVNNVGKGGGKAKTLKFVLKLRAGKLPESEEEQVIPEFVKHLVPLRVVPQPPTVVAVLRLVPPDRQLTVARAILRCDRIAKEQAEALAKTVAAELGLKAPLETAKVEVGDPAVIERQGAWLKIKTLLSQRSDPAVVAAAIRARLHTKYDPDEIKQSWITLTEADPMSLIKVFCQLPYLPDGTTDPLARTIIESNVTRLTHEKYAATYKKVVNSLRSTLAARPDHPTVMNFIALIKWVDPEAAQKFSVDVGIPVAA